MADITLKTSYQNKRRKKNSNASRGRFTQSFQLPKLAFSHQNWASPSVWRIPRRTKWVTTIDRVRHCHVSGRPYFWIVGGVNAFLRISTIFVIGYWIMAASWVCQIFALPLCAPHLRQIRAGKYITGASFPRWKEIKRSVPYAESLRLLSARAEARARIGQD